MTSTLLSINNYHYRRGGAEVVFFRHNAIFEQAGWDVVPFSMRHEENVPSRWGNYFVEEIELGRATDNLLTRARKGLKAVYSLAVIVGHGYRSVFHIAYKSVCTLFNN
mgnify:CR=1 FL=1